jgi:leucyl aminopeptidase
VALPEQAGLASAEVAGLVRAAVEGALLGAYRFERYRSERKKGDALSALTVAAPAGAARSRQVAEAVDLARRLSAAVAWARDLVNLGPAECTPTLLAAAAARLARQSGLRCTVRGPRQIAALHMGLFQGVARGSAEPPALVSLSWVPRGPAARARPVVLVGKAVTFDSGGLSLKPSDSMTTMHTDMAGAAAVVAAMQVVAALRPAFPVHAVFGACENMPGGRAYKPSDVLTAHGGQTVEISNTDAEGRLVLGDVLSWAAATWKPAALVDVATLTGACMVALGLTTAGVFGPDGPVVEGVLAAARRAGEDAWRLPLTEACAENLKSDRADMKNSGDRMGSAIAAAHFLRRFTRESPWAHLDIAGPSHAPRERGHLAPGATGYGVRTLVEFVRSWKATGRARSPGPRSAP